MSLLDKIQVLPPVIQPPPQEPPKEEKKQFDIELEDEKEDLDKQFIIVMSRDMSSEDEAVFAQHGKVLRWKKESFFNLPFSDLDFSFLLIDVREKEARLTLNRQDLTKYNKVCYCYSIQKGIDDFLTELNTIDISSIPKYAINSKDFRHQLMHQKLPAPSIVRSFLRWGLKCLFG